MTSEEFLSAVQAAKPAEREALAERLLKELSPGDRLLVESMLGDFLAGLDSGEVTEAPPGMRLT